MLLQLWAQGPPLPAVAIENSGNESVKPGEKRGNSNRVGHLPGVTAVGPVTTTFGTLEGQCLMDEPEQPEAQERSQGFPDPAMPNFTYKRTHHALRGRLRKKDCQRPAR